MRCSTRLSLLCSVFVVTALFGAPAHSAETADTEQTLWSPYWTVERGFTSTLSMKNNRIDRSLTAHVSLYFPSGDETNDFLGNINYAPYTACN